MATKLRKMLGRADDPNILSLMHLLDTQSLETISNWALDMVAEYALPILWRHELHQLDFLCECTRAYLDGNMSLKEMKPMFKEATTISKEIKDPTAQAASKALITACKTIQTPTGSLGYVFYLAAAIAYDSLGKDQAAEVYDHQAQEIFAMLEEKLEQRKVQDEKNPIHVNWNC